MTANNKYYLITILVIIMNSSLVFMTMAKNSYNDFLAVNNAARAKVGVAPLLWNTTVAAYARAYATKRSKDCKLEHSDGPYGENISEGWGDEFTAVEGVKLWVGEEPYYDYDSNSCTNGEECLHYTQVVWRKSTQLGCARVKCNKDGWWFIICNYDPPGNYDGEKPY